MDETAVLKARYLGRRFEHLGLPVSCAAELMGLQRALWVIYRHRFVQSTGRQRAPRRYKDQLDLTLCRLEAGSTIAVFEPTASRQLPPENMGGDALRLAIEELLCMLRLKFNNDYGGQAKSELVRSFREFGQDLRDGEAVELTSGASTARYDLDRRREVLALFDSNATHANEQVFAVSEFDKEQKSFLLISAQGETVRVQARDQVGWRQAALDAFLGYESLAKNLKVLVAGVFEYNNAGRLLNIQPDTIEILGERDLRWRLDFLRHHNQENPRTLLLLDRLTELWQVHFTPLEAYAVPHLYILDELRVSLEWDRAPRVTFELEDRCWRISALDLEDELEGSVERPEDLGKAVELLIEWLSSGAEPIE